MHILGHRITPNGPNLKCPLRYDLNLSGTKLSLDVPENNGTWDQGQKSKLAHSYDLYSSDYYQNDEKDVYVPEELNLVLKRWQFWGIPFFHRDSFAVSEFQVVVSKMPDFANLFRPRRLECAIERFLYTGRVVRKVIPCCMRRSWRTVEIGENSWVNYFYNINETNKRETVGSVWHLAITENHLLTLRFEVYVKWKPQLVKGYFEEIMNLVIGSLRLELSQYARSERDRVKAEYPYESLSASMPPYDFEQMIWYEHYDMIGKVSSEVENSHSMQNDKFDKLVADAEADQERRYQEMRARIMATHMRFNELEAEDLKRFRSGQDSKS